MALSMNERWWIQIGVEKSGISIYCIGMAKDFERYESLSIITERPSGRYPATEDLDHLTYLDKGSSLFEDGAGDSMKEWRLICAHCGHLVTTVGEKIEVLGRHHHDFPYYGDIVRLGCYRNAPGCVGIERVSNGYSWFRGYSWQIQLCLNCHIQLGWKYVSHDDSFYGLVFKMLREKKTGEGNTA